MLSNLAFYYFIMEFLFNFALRTLLGLNFNKSVKLVTRYSFGKNVDKKLKIFVTEVFSRHIRERRVEFLSVKQ
jgi:hypothetical protein